MNISLLISVFLATTTAYQVPFCFSSGVTWASSVSGGYQSVGTPEECQRICDDSYNCDSVTWYNGQASPHPDYCEMFLTPDPSKEAPCSNCTSGPESCTCSGGYTCSLESDQLIDLIFGISSELSCAELCYPNPECEYYSWYTPYSPTLKSTCALLKSCSTRAGSNSCFSGPSDCLDTDTIESEYPLCFTVGATWIGDRSKGVANVTSPYDCQSLCNTDPDCSSFTWFNTLSSPYPNYCEFYPSQVSSPSSPCTNCISGLSTCTCSIADHRTCETNHDLVIDFFQDVVSEVQCQDMCARNEKCSWYVWYSAQGDRLQMTCFLLESCISTMECQGCYSGPDNCQDINTLPPPPQCSNYQVLDSFTRNININEITDLCGTHTYCCDQAGTSAVPSDWAGPAYYRFSGAAGSQLAEDTSLYMKCGTGLGGYMLGGHPSVGEGEVSRTVYFDNNGSPNSPTEITVTNCVAFYVYYLIDVPSCKKGYCGVFV